MEHIFVLKGILFCEIESWGSSSSSCPLNTLLLSTSFVVITVEPRCNEVLRDWQNMFAMTRFRYIKVVFHIFYVLLGEDRSLYRRSTVTSDCYIIVCLNP